MDAIIQGFIIAIFVILSGVFIRLGLLLQAIEEKKEKKDKNNRSCSTCICSDMSAFDEPCRYCVHLEDKPYYEEDK